MTERVSEGPVVRTAGGEIEGLAEGDTDGATEGISCFVYCSPVYYLVHLRWLR
jgi:hypothetical protein